jgi:putative NADPH-quinone reductase
MCRRHSEADLNVLIINGHPDPSPERFCAALAKAYAAGARAAGHPVREIAVGNLEFPMIRSRATFEDSAVPPAILAAQEDIRWADHVVIVHPLWLGSAPAVLKGFIEQTFRYGFALAKPGEGRGFPGLLVGRSARLVVTMGMPAAFFRLVFGGFGVRALERGILRLAGFGPIHHDYIGLVEGPAAGRARWLARMEGFGRKAL